MKQLFALLAAVCIVIFIAAELENLPATAARWGYPAHNHFLGVYAWQWAGLGVIAVVSVLAGAVGRAGFNSVTKLRDRFGAISTTEATRRGIARSGGVIVGALLAVALIPDLEIVTRRGRLEHEIVAILEGLAVAGLVLQLYGWWDVLSDTIAHRAEGHRRAERLLVPMMRKFVRAIIVITGVLIAISIFFGPRTLGGMIAGLGITGLVVALAAKDSVENVFGSITILFDMPFAIGDWVKIDKAEGTVEEINLRSTRIRTAEDTLINLPNANLIRAAVENFGARRFRRERVLLRASYKTDFKALSDYCTALAEFLEALPTTISGKTVVELDDPQENSVGIVAVWFTNADNFADEARARHALLEEAIRIRGQFNVIFMGSG